MCKRKQKEPEAIQQVFDLTSSQNDEIKTDYIACKIVNARQRMSNYLKGNQSMYVTSTLELSEMVLKVGSVDIEGNSGEVLKKLLRCKLNDLLFLCYDHPRAVRLHDDHKERLEARHLLFDLVIFSITSIITFAASVLTMYLVSGAEDTSSDTFLSSTIVTIFALLSVVRDVYYKFNDYEKRLVGIDDQVKRCVKSLLHKINPDHPLFDNTSGRGTPNGSSPSQLTVHTPMMDDVRKGQLNYGTATRVRRLGARAQDHIERILNPDDPPSASTPASLLLPVGTVEDLVVDEDDDDSKD
jgi:hypothetical protein